MELSSKCSNKVNTKHNITQQSKGFPYIIKLILQRGVECNKFQNIVIILIGLHGPPNIWHVLTNVMNIVNNKWQIKNYAIHKKFISEIGLLHFYLIVCEIKNFKILQRFQPTYMLHKILQKDTNSLDISQTQDQTPKFQQGQ